jgi:hypothetical protein
MKKEDLLAEVDDLLRTMPRETQLGAESPESLSWLGRASAIIGQWNVLKGPIFSHHVRLYNRSSIYAPEALKGILTMLHEARHDLRMQTLGPMTAAFEKGRVFDYFDEIRKLVEEASQDVLFVDPYLDAEFVSRYLPHAASGVTIRLLAREKMSSLLSSVDSFARQSGQIVQVRSAPGFHDRYFFLDHRACYQSGASFKDGGKTSPTTLTQITDAFPAVLQTYEDLWNRAKFER